MLSKVRRKIFTFVTANFQHTMCFWKENIHPSPILTRLESHWVFKHVYDRLAKWHYYVRFNLDIQNPFHSIWYGTPYLDRNKNSLLLALLSFHSSAVNLYIFQHLCHRFWYNLQNFPVYKCKFANEPADQVVNKAKDLIVLQHLKKEKTKTL